MTIDPRQLAAALKRVDISDWKPYELEFGADAIRFPAPPNFTELSMGRVAPVRDVKAAVAEALSNPIGSEPIKKIAASRGKDPARMIAAVTVSDITRPVNYKGEDGILRPVLDALESAGLKRSNIRIIVGTGTHRPSTHEEKLRMFGEDIVSGGYHISDHDCENEELLIEIGETRSGTPVQVNRLFAEADVRIATGLVESHFMAGVSGGRKAVCPGLVNLTTIQKFHSPRFLERPSARNLVLENNPCHQEALEVAKRVGVDFIVNSTFDKDMNVTGVFAGDLEKAHEAATAKIRTYVQAPIREPFDIVVTHAGYVGRNHYQAAKAAVGAENALKPGSVLIMAANNCDREPIGSPEYRTLIHLLALQGSDGYIAAISRPQWKFTRDQWQPEMWAHPLKTVGHKNLVYCTRNMEPEAFAFLPGTSGYAMLAGDERHLPELECVGRMVRNALILAVHQARAEGREPGVAIIREGPYVVPALK